MKHPLTKFGGEMSTAMAILESNPSRFCHKLGIDRSALNQYLHDPNIGLATMQVLAAFLGCEVHIEIKPRRKEA